MTKKLWGGRFQKSLDQSAQEFSYSLKIDQRLFPYDLKVNLAHAKALFEKQIITEKELVSLTGCIDGLLNRYEKSDKTLFDGNDEDVHSCVERLITEELGELGKKIHTGKSRNDQVSTDTRLFVKDAIADIVSNIETLLKSIFEKATQYQDLIFPGFTHLQPAQPVLLSHHFLAYFEMLSRDRHRFLETFERTDVCVLGSGAMAGNNYELDRSLVAKELGFSKLSRNSMDGVSDRDYIVELCSHASLTMTHLTRLCEELILWCSPLTGFIEIGDEFTTGSSIMPQKKNPDIAELIRGKSSRVFGHMVSIQHLLKSLPLTYNRDMQEDKPLLFDTIDTLNDSLICMAKMLSTITVRKASIQLALKKGYMLATDFADYLVKKGVPFRTSHEITGKVVMFAIESNRHLEDLTLEELHSFSDKIDRDVKQIFDMKQAIDSKDVYGGTALKRVRYQLRKIEEEFKWNKP